MRPESPNFLAGEAGKSVPGIEGTIVIIGPGWEGCDVLDPQGFDIWADGYDESVERSDGQNRYPFAGYNRVLRRIFHMVMEKPHAMVLDIGFGTGTLTSKLYESGCEIWGQDFSARMCALAGQKMPRAHLYCGDFTRGLAGELRAQRYDAIVSTYALHHLTDAQKLAFIPGLLPLLRPGGRLIIGDVAFENAEAQNLCRIQAGTEWDDEEYYFVYDALKPSLDGLQFERMSDCAGILTLQR